MQIQVRAFKKHKTQDVYWDFKDKVYVKKEQIPLNALIIDHTGRIIKA